MVTTLCLNWIHPKHQMFGCIPIISPAYQQYCWLFSGHHHFPIFCGEKAMFFMVSMVNWEVMINESWTCIHTYIYIYINTCMYSIHTVTVYIYVYKAYTYIYIAYTYIYIVYKCTHQNPIYTMILYVRRFRIPTPLWLTRLGAFACWETRIRTWWWRCQKIYSVYIYIY